jgi:hypothetical protein
MGKINLGRVLLGGIVAGIVSDVLGFLVDGWLLAPRWADGMKMLGKPSVFTTHQIIAFNLLGLLGGIALIWIYAAIRPRFGAGAKTAVIAGLFVWFVGTLLPNAGFMYVPHLYSKHLTLYTTLGGIVELVVGALAGAALYKESA